MALLLCLRDCWLHGTPFVKKVLLKNAGCLLMSWHPMLQLNPKMLRMLLRNICNS